MVNTDEAVEFIQVLAAGDVTEPQLKEWIRSHVKRR